MKRKHGIRNQYGMALWLKILLGLFATGLLISVVIGIIAFTVVKDAMDPKKTKETANKICALSDPLPAPFEYGQMNLSMGGLSLALINNTASKALYILIKSPHKEGDNAQKAIDKVANGETSLPSANGTVTSSDASGSASSKNTIKVEDKGVLDVADNKMYYVKGKATSQKAAAASGASSTAGMEMDTFFGAVDNKDGNTSTFLMVQETDPTKQLTLDEVKTFTGCIKSF